MRGSKKVVFHVKHRTVRNTLVIELGKLHRVLSSAPRGGGLIRARSILNHQVSPNPALLPSNGSVRVRRTMRCSDPARYLAKVALVAKAAFPVVGLMTAVPMKRLVKGREESQGIWIECFCTVGVTNAVRAGDPAIHRGETRRCSHIGTINIILVTNATLATPAMVGAVQVATESKTATLIEMNVRNASGRRHATGTGTDAVVVAASIAGKYRVQYSGTHTNVGSMVGRLVARCIREGLNRSPRSLSVIPQSLAAGSHGPLH
ncbi:MAG TPA: adenosylcobinamide amidohydrolase [Nitrospira sp.]|nr:adenosylcobinamide amidohydrolase [Nitrospira sp.]